MAKPKLICRVCGKEYEPCRTSRKPGVFHYQEFACSPEHGAIYLEQVLRARGELVDEPVIEPESNTEEDPVEDLDY